MLAADMYIALSKIIGLGFSNPLPIFGVYG